MLQLLCLVMEQNKMADHKLVNTDFLLDIVINDKHQRNGQILPNKHNVTLLNQTYEFKIVCVTVTILKQTDLMHFRMIHLVHVNKLLQTYVEGFDMFIN